MTGCAQAAFAAGFGILETSTAGMVLVAEPFGRDGAEVTAWRTASAQIAAPPIAYERAHEHSITQRAFIATSAASIHPAAQQQASRRKGATTVMTPRIVGLAALNALLAAGTAAARPRMGPHGHDMMSKRLLS